MTKLRNFFLLAVVMIASVTTLSSCGSDDDWDDGRFIDNRLNGYWELVESEGSPVYGQEVNYMLFDGNGTGLYYYWYRGRRYIDDLYYTSQYSYGGASEYSLLLQYGNDRPTLVDYWFEGRNTLCMQWVADGYGLVTYVYRRVPGAPW
ncbi:MAG: hypothetical protein HDS79_02605 [Bacteroidales bacterium]|nr:hypothetical protein [Bacteroidales bacterium]